MNPTVSLVATNVSFSAVVDINTQNCLGGGYSLLGDASGNVKLTPNYDRSSNHFMCISLFGFYIGLTVSVTASNGVWIPTSRLLQASIQNNETKHSRELQASSIPLTLTFTTNTDGSVFMSVKSPSGTSQYGSVVFAPTSGCTYNPTSFCGATYPGSTGNGASGSTTNGIPQNAFIGAMVGASLGSAFIIGILALIIMLRTRDAKNTSSSSNLSYKRNQVLSSKSSQQDTDNNDNFMVTSPSIKNIRDFPQITSTSRNNTWNPGTITRKHASVRAVTNASPETNTVTATNPIARQKANNITQSLIVL
jgi:hypothetical protein